MRELLPTGTVTLLLVDVEGSTRLWESQPAEMSTAFALLDHIIADSVAVHQGVRPVEQGEGDSFVVAFARASDAVDCALELQRARLTPIRLRIGVHTGEVQLRDGGNYIGPTINKTARLRDLGHGGQTLLSGTTEELVLDSLPAGAWLTHLGTHSLRGVKRPARVVQLCHPDLRNAFPPLRTSNAGVSQNLPTQLTTFVGRGEEIKHVQQLMSEHRLVTLTGAGGAGKTRLSLEIAAQRANEHPHGIWFIDLAPITDPDTVAITAARSLGLPDQSGPSAVETLIRFIGERRIMVVLDNCEHLVDASARLVTALLIACPGLTVLATSREPIGVSGEVTWRVPSLSTADDAVELFTDRARCVRPDFTVTEESIATVTEICRRLDGMPLAIELAAARVRALSLDDILDGLHDRFRLLTGGARTSMRRQQTLRASVDWSYALLSESERNLFRRLAVFRGGFDLDAAHVVAAGTDVERYDVLDEITLLVDKSLVVAEDSRGQARYRLLETVRQYAMEKLAESHESEVIRRRHFDFYMAMVNDLGTRLRASPGHRRSQPQMQQLLDHAVTEVDNLRAAFASGAELAPDPDLLIKAAYAAAWLVDLVLADRLADAAIRVGGGTDASFIRAYALSFLGRGQEAEAVLAEARAGELSETDDGRLAFLQATNRLFALADPAGAKRLIDRMSRTPARQDRNCVHAFLTVYWAAMGKPAAARESSERVAWDELPAVAARASAWAVAVAAGEAGSTADATAAAERGYPIPIRGYFVLTDAHAGALLLAGRIAEAHDIAEIFARRVWVEVLRQFQPICTAIVGRVALAAGQLGTACSSLESAGVMFAAMGETYGWGYRNQLARTTALAVSGKTAEAAAELVLLEKLRHPGWRYLDYELAIARGWVAACRGAAREAISSTLSAAETARNHGQFAAEVMCLQTATQFGDSSRAKRLRELAEIVEGPRAGVAARFTTALSAGDADELALVSNDFEIMGDLVAAIDAAAYAAVAYRRQEARESGFTCATRAETLATRAETLSEQYGVHTPALRQSRPAD